MASTKNDFIETLGFVTLYAGYLEHEISNLLDYFDFYKIYNKDMVNLPISAKLKQINNIFKTIDNTIPESVDNEGIKNNINEIITDLGKCSDVINKRNKIIHGFIYHDYREKEIKLKSVRSSADDKIITLEELQILMVELNNLQSSVRNIKIRLKLGLKTIFNKYLEYLQK